MPPLALLRAHYINILYRRAALHCHSLSVLSSSRQRCCVEWSGCALVVRRSQCGERATSNSPGRFGRLLLCKYANDCLVAKMLLSEAVVVLYILLLFTGRHTQAHSHNSEPAACLFLFRPPRSPHPGHRVTTCVVVAQCGPATSPYTCSFCNTHMPRIHTHPHIKTHTSTHTHIDRSITTVRTTGSDN